MRLLLFGFLVERVLPAEGAVFVHFQSVGIVFLVFHRLVVSLFALAAGKGDSFSHAFFHNIPPNNEISVGFSAKKKDLFTAQRSISSFFPFVNRKMKKAKKVLFPRQKTGKNMKNVAKMYSVFRLVVL